jgi:excisionase family DNA binding protein
MATEYMTKQEFARLMRIHVRSLERAIKRGWIRSIKVGGSVRVPRSELSRLLVFRQGPTTPSVFADTKSAHLLPAGATKRFMEKDTHAFMDRDWKLLSVTEAAELCRLKASTIRRWVLKRRVPFVKLGRRVLFRQTDIERLIKRSVVPAHTSARRTEVTR